MAFMPFAICIHYTLTCQCSNCEAGFLLPGIYKTSPVARLLVLAALLWPLLRHLNVDSDLSSKCFVFQVTKMSQALDSVAHRTTASPNRMPGSIRFSSSVFGCVQNSLVELSATGGYKTLTSSDVRFEGMNYWMSSVLFEDVINGKDIGIDTNHIPFLTMLTILNGSSVPKVSAIAFATLFATISVSSIERLVGTFLPNRASIAFAISFSKFLCWM